MSTPTSTDSTAEHKWKVRSGALSQKLGAFCLKTARSHHPGLTRTPLCKIFSAENRPLLASPPRRPCGNGSLARGPHCSSRCVFAPARSAGPPGASLAPGPLHRGGTGCNGLSWDLVFRALPGATGGGSGAPTTRWGGCNCQAPPGKPLRRRTDSPSHHLFWVETSC